MFFSSAVSLGSLGLAVGVGRKSRSKDGLFFFFQLMLGYRLLLIIEACSGAHAHVVNSTNIRAVCVPGDAPALWTTLPGAATAHTHHLEATRPLCAAD